MITTLTLWARRAAPTTLLAVAVLVAGSVQAAPSINGINAARTSGTAPLAVVFDAKNTTDPVYSREFHSLHYVWDFDDEGAGTWQFSGKGKNSAAGPVAGHLFTEPGTYDVELTATNPAGEVDSQTIQITVHDPDVTWSGTRTTCVSSSGNFSGCASGARQVTSSSWASSVDNADGRRTLFRRGDTFSGSGINLATADGTGSMIGTYGSGARARVNISNSATAIHINDDWRIVGMHFVGPDQREGPHEYLVKNNRPTRQFTLYDSSIEAVKGCIGLNQAGGTMNEQIAIVDVHCRATGTAHRSIFEKSERSMWMGLHLDTNTPGSGTTGFRCIHFNTSVFQHALMDTGAGGSAFSIRTSSTYSGTQHVVFSDNTVIERRGTVPFRVCTEQSCANSGAGQNNDNLIIENNLWVNQVSGNAPSNKWFQIAGGDITIRNNVLDLRHFQNGTYMVVDKITDAQAPGHNHDNIHVLNNTVYATGDINTLRVCRSNVGSGHTCRGNLVHSPGTSIELTSGAFSSGGNVTSASYSGSPFDGTIPSSSSVKLGDYALRAGSPAIDSGYDFVSSANQAVFMDAVGGCRELGSGMDAGAHERGAQTCVAGLGGGGPIAPPPLPPLAAPDFLP